MRTVVASERTQAVWEAVIERCCGLDVHQEMVTACLLAGALDQQPGESLRTFSTTTRGLLELRDWLEEHGCSHVAIESTGIYWRPVFHILEDMVTVLLVNALSHETGAREKDRPEGRPMDCPAVEIGIIETQPDSSKAYPGFA